MISVLSGCIKKPLPATIKGEVTVTFGEINYSDYSVYELQITFIGPEGQEYIATTEEVESSYSDEEMTFTYSVDVNNTGTYDAEVEALVSHVDTGEDYKTKTAEYKGVVIVEEGEVYTSNPEFPLDWYFNP